MSQSFQEQIEDLKAQVRHWKTMAGEPAGSVISDLMERGLTIQQAQILACLYTKTGMIQKDVLIRLVWGQAEPELASNVLGVQICHLRRKLGSQSINTIWGLGFRPTDSGRERVAAMLAAPPSDRFHARRGREENRAHA